jgi:hypothetical protein
MPGIQPQSLTDEELARHIYMQLGAPLPSDWVAELLVRFNEKLDAEAELPAEDAKDDAY